MRIRTNSRIGRKETPCGGRATDGRCHHEEHEEHEGTRLGGLPIRRGEDRGAPVSTARRGFTLIEVLLVVVIIGILVGVAVPKLSGRVKQAQIQGTRKTIAAVALALDVYEVDIGHYPNSIQQLITSSGEVNWNGPYLKDGRMPKDAWGVDIQYSVKGEGGYEVRAAGPDGQMGSGDDITN